MWLRVALLAPFLAVSAILGYLAYSAYLTAVELARSCSTAKGLLQGLALLVSSCVAMLQLTIFTTLSAAFLYLGLRILLRNSTR